VYEMRRVAKGTRARKTANEKLGAQPKSYYVYLLLCDDGSYYTGYTSNVASRLERHKIGSGARYTRMRKPKRVVYVEKFRTRLAAIRRERRIKALNHREKHNLASTYSPSAYC
jgi:putative endonuclease